MGERARDAERKLSDYPISLRHSARAVFGSDCDREEKRPLEPVGRDMPRSKS